MAPLNTDYEITVGLEVHIELATASKIFCGCAVTFAAEPNTHICPVCMGLPGTLPVLNNQVIAYALMACLALHSQITPITSFDRKNYFYPDLPKAYQISQLYAPIGQGGYLDVKSCNKRIRIHELHMEEDAGKLLHNQNETSIDYNRCGVPLLEIVSEPDFHSADEVVAYLEALREMFQFLEISDCKMQEGSMRADINLSVRPKSANQLTLGVRTEMKNMNSLKAIRHAINSEAKRQIAVIEGGGEIVMETRRWDENNNTSNAMRNKESVHDYRYFPDPDMLPVTIPQNWIETLRQTMNEMPEAKRTRYQRDFGLSTYDAQVLTTNNQIAALFEEAVAIVGSAKVVANFIMTDVMRLVKVVGHNYKMPSAQNLAVIIVWIGEGKINRTTGSIVFEKMFTDDIDPIAYIDENELWMVDERTYIHEVIEKVLLANKKSVDDYVNGKQKAFTYLVGQTMKALEGKANPQIVNQLLKEKLT